MKKLYCLLLLCCLCSLNLLAQKQDDLKPEDKKEVQGLTIKIKSAPKGTYLFDIEQGPIRLQTGKQNPATMLSKGFASKGDAFKVAEWMIRQYKKDGFMPAVVPPHVLAELKINERELFKN